MIVTTTNNIEGHSILEYRGIVFGEYTGKANNSLESCDEALRQIQIQAESLGANAVVGISFEYELIDEEGGWLTVNASGTAVLID